MLVKRLINLTILAVLAVSCIGIARPEFAPAGEQPGEQPGKQPGKQDQEDDGEVTEIEDTEIVSIPDPEFKAYMIWRYDANGDGELSRSEAQAVEAVEFQSDAIYSLTGLERCGSLNKLNIKSTPIEHGDEYKGKITSIDLTHNTALSELSLEFQNIEKINLTQCTELRRISLYLCPINKLNISTLKHLTLLSAGCCSLEEIDLSQSPALVEVHLDNNRLKTITVGNLPELEYIDISGNALEEADFSECRRLNTLNCHDNPELHTIYLKKGQVLGALIKDEHTKLIYID